MVLYFACPTAHCICSQEMQSLHYQEASWPQVAQSEVQKLKDQVALQDVDICRLQASLSGRVMVYAVRGLSSYWQYNHVSTALRLVDIVI